MKVNILNTISHVERSLEIPGDELLIGSAIECDLVLEGDGIDDQHLRIAEIDTEYFSKTVRDEYDEIEAVFHPIKNLMISKPKMDELKKLNGPIEVGHYIISFPDRQE